MAQEKIEKIIRNILEMDDCEKESFLKYVKEHTIKYILCMDMGCGGTSTAFYEIENGIIIPVLWRYKTRHRKDGELIDVVGLFLPTIIGYDIIQSDEPVVGPEAFEYGRAAENFKKLPDEEALKEKVLTVQNAYGEENGYSLFKIWTDYFRKIFEESLHFLKKQQNITCSKEEILFVVAHPSGDEWARKEILENYKKMIVKGTGLCAEQIITISESKAAMQYVRRLRNVSVDWSKGVLMIDLGASTIDIEYLSQNCIEPKEYSITMAGREADKILAYDVLCKTNPKLKAEYPTLNDFLWDERLWTEDNVFEEKLENLEATRAQWMYKIRGFKEAICDNPVFDEPVLFEKSLYYAAARSKTTIPVSELTILEEVLEQNEFSFACSDMAIAVYMNKGFIGNGVKGAQLVKGSWYSHLEKLVSYALDELQDENYSISDIIVTGGSSRLVGVEKHIRKGIETSNIENKTGIHLIMLTGELDYERTVPFGSCYYVGNAIKHLDEICQFPALLRKCLDKTIKEEKALTICVANALVGLLDDVIKDAVKIWSEVSISDRRSSLNGLDEILRNRISKIPFEQLDACVSTGVFEFQKNSSETMAPIYKEINQFLTRLLSENQNKSYKIHIEKIKIKIEMNEVSQMVSGICERVKMLHSSDLQNSLAALLIIIFTIFARLFFGVNKKYIRWPGMYRKKVLNQIPKMEIEMRNDLIDMLHEEIVDAYERKQRFHLEEQILESMSDDIKRALYLP